MTENPGLDEGNPFKEFIISDKWVKLNDLSERTVCAQCNKSRKYFCYTCYLPVPDIADIIPVVELPLSVDIIKHSKEIDGKSTAVHAAVICPKQVNIYTYPSIPNYTSDDEALLVFPGKNAVSVGELVTKALEEKCSDSAVVGLTPFKKVILIDSTWNQCKGIFKDPRISALPAVILKNRTTQFWRHQNGVPRTHLSTIEAIHQFFIEYQEAFSDYENRVSGSSRIARYNGQYDNLLFFFRFMYDKIHTLYEHDSLKSYKRPLV